MSNAAQGPIPFNRPLVTGTELDALAEPLATRRLSAGGPIAERCREWLRETVGATEAFTVHSCASALEIAAQLAGVGPGSEVVMPSFGYVSTACAFARLGATLVFVDVDADTYNIDPASVEAAITSRTRAVVPIHYAGIAADVDAVAAAAPSVLIVEDAALGLGGTYRGRPLGSLGDVGTVSFHETKVITCGEGGALLVNREDWINRAEIIWHKGTDRARFNRGETDFYSWVDIGSSHALSELHAAVLWAQMQAFEKILRERGRVWDHYHKSLAALEKSGVARRPVVPPQVIHNGNTYFLVLDAALERDVVLQRMKAEGVEAVFHYVPLHSSPAGRRLGRPSGALIETARAAAQLVRLPLWTGMSLGDVDRVVEVLERAIDDSRSSRRHRRSPTVSEPQST